MPQDLTDDIGSGNGLVPSGYKPLPEPIRTKFYEATGHHKDTISYKAPQSPLATKYSAGPVKFAPE